MTDPRRRGPAGAGPRPSPGTSLRLQILGPLRLWRDGVELDAGPRQQAYLLALLLARPGRPISTSNLIDLIWDGDVVPASALNVIHKYVGALRRLLQPGLPHRGTGSYLLRRGNGYVFVAGSAELDAVNFRYLVGSAETSLAEPRDDRAALDHYAEALGLWHGPAGEGLAHGSGAASVFAGLDGEFFDACAAAAELALALGRPERVLKPLQLAAEMAPLHEPVQAALIAALSAAGKHAEAVLVFHAVRKRLSHELGIDPGAAIQAAYLEVLTRTTSPVDAHGADDPPAPAGRPADPARVSPANPVPPATDPGMVGRTEELAKVRQALDAASADRTGLVVVEGEPGIGKTRLLEEVAREAERRGAPVMRGRCLEGGAAPSMWPWIRVVSQVLQTLPVKVREQWLTGELGQLVEPPGNVRTEQVSTDGGAQFWLFEQVVAVFSQAAAQQPLVLVVDDLQWADLASLQLTSHLATRLPAGTVLVCALRDRAPTPGTDLARTLAAVSRQPGHRRIRLGRLGEREVAEIVRYETGYDPGPGAAPLIHARTAGNPFFARELSRLLAGGGPLTEDAVAGAGVPASVRDIVLDRMAGLGDETLRLLRIAALIGREVDLGLLARAVGLDVQACLDALEPLEAMNLLEPAPGNPFSLRFAHDLVRESVADTVHGSLAPPLHLRIADALEKDDAASEAAAERLAYHLWAAGPLAEPARTAGALVRAGRSAALKSAFEAAERQLQAFPDVERRGQNPLRRDIQLLRPGIQALVTGMHGDFDGARARFDAMEAAAGDDAQLITLWAHFSCLLAEMADDPVWALRVVKRTALDPDHPYVYLDHYLRLFWCWARALTDDDDAGGAAAEAEAVLTTGLVDPPMSGLAFHYGLLGQMFLAAGQPDEAARILDLADRTLEAYGQRYAEGLLLLLRARLLQARGAPIAEVRAVAERARALATEREAHLFARRAENFLAELAD